MGEGFAIAVAVIFTAAVVYAFGFDMGVASVHRRIKQYGAEAYVKAEMTERQKP
jgi:hypothetical protein